MKKVNLKICFFYFRIGSIFWHVEENLGFSIYLNNLLSPRTQDCVDVSHLKISWELMKSDAWCDNYAREDMTNSQCAKWHDENWSNVKKRRQRHASLTTTSASAVFQNLNDWLLVSEKILFRLRLTFFPLGSEYSFGWSVIRLLRPHLTWLWKVSGRWRGELPIGETPAEGWGGNVKIRTEEFLFSYCLQKMIVAPPF